MSVGVPDWAEWYADDVKQYISGVEYDRIKAFEPWRLNRIVSISQFKNEDQGGVSRSQVLTNSKKGYNDYPYIRSKVVNREIIEAVREVLGVKEGEAIPLVFDGKVTPVVVLNDSIKFSSWKLNYSVVFNVRGLFIDNSGFMYVEYGGGDEFKCFDKLGNLVIDSDGDSRYFSEVTHNIPRCRNYLFVQYPVGGSYHVQVYFKGQLVYTVEPNTTNCFVESSESGRYFCVYDSVSGDLFFYEGVV